MIVDCDSCVMKDVACSDCFVTFLLERPAEPGPVELDDDAAGALQVLAEAALVPPLRLVTPDHPEHDHPEHDHPEPDHPEDGRRVG